MTIRITYRACPVPRCGAEWNYGAWDFKEDEVERRIERHWNHHLRDWDMDGITSRAEYFAALHESTVYERVPDPAYPIMSPDRYVFGPDRSLDSILDQAYRTLEEIDEATDVVPAVYWDRVVLDDESRSVLPQTYGWLSQATPCRLPGSLS